MSLDPTAAQILRDDLAALDGIRERPMFGGLAMMRRGHMLAGVMSTGALLYRVGKPHESAACAWPGVAPMIHGGRRMGGFVMLPALHYADHATRAALLAMALAHAETLPPKEEPC